MKKRVFLLLAVLFSAILVSSFIFRNTDDTKYSAHDRNYEESDGERTDILFENIEYSRPDLEEMRKNIDVAEEALENKELNKTASMVYKLLDKCYADYTNFYTMYNLANIRSCQNMSDEFYSEEYNWCDENYSLVLQYMDELYYACAASDMAKRLEKNYFWDGFCEEYSDSGESNYNEETVALMNRESALLAEYHALNTSPTVTVDGENVDYYTHLYDSEDYYGVQMDYYNKYNGEYAEVYKELILVRRALAETLGYDSYEQMQYESYFERDYTPEQAEDYIKNIKEYLVPVYKEAREAGLYDEVDYNYLSERKLMKIIHAGASRMGGDILDAFDFMCDGGYYDVAVSTDKAAMSFQSYLTDYEAPFLFVDAYGDTEDILSVAHEFGHYADAYVNFDSYETIDLSECYSQAMEYLMLSYLDEVLSGRELENIRLMKLRDTLELYVQQASFAEFESRIYALEDDELTTENFNAISLELAREYGYCDKGNEEYYAMSWIDIPHFFEMPFYVISYPVSNDIAMQIYALENDRRGAGLEKYKDMLQRETGSLMEAVQDGGFESPFDEGRAEAAAAELRQKLLQLEAAA